MYTQEIKDRFVSEAIQHREADLYIKGCFWDGHKGCSIGCSAKTNKYPHAKLAGMTGLPEWLHWLQDTIFEGLPSPDNLYWTEQLFSAIPAGSTEESLEQVKRDFLVIVLKSTFDTFDHEKFAEIKKAIDNVIELYESGETDLTKFKDAARAAAYAADVARVARDARDAARDTARTTRDTARTTRAAAYAAAHTARVAAYAAARDDAYAAYAAEAAAYAEKFKYFANELINLLTDKGNDIDVKKYKLQEMK